MKVAVLTQYFPTSLQPWAGHSAYQTLRELAQICDLHVFYPEAVYPRGLAPKTAAARLDPGWNPPGVQATYVSYPVLPVISRPLNGYLIATRLLLGIQSYRPDILLNYVVYPDGYAAVRIGKRLNIPVVLTAIGSDLNRIPGALVRTFTQAALRGAAAVTTVSHDLARTAVRLGASPETTTAILNGCDTSVFRPQPQGPARDALGIAPDAELIVYVGRLDLRKGLAELVEAVAELRASRPRMLACLVGDGPDRGTLEALIASKNAGETIRLISACPTAEVARWMAAASLVTLPSYMEGCPNVVLEALSAGRPMVSTRVGGIPELMDDQSGRLVAPRDAAALAGALAEVLGLHWDADEIAGRHRRSWAEVAADLYGVLAARVGG